MISFGLRLVNSNMSHVAAALKIRTLRQGGIMFIALNLASLLNYLFHFVTGRILEPVEYGVVAAVIAAINLFSLPTSALSTVVARFVAHYEAVSEPEQISFLVRRLLKWTTLLGVLIAALVASQNEPIAGFLNLNVSTPVLILALIVLPAWLVALSTGVLQGLQRYLLWGTSAVAGAASRLMVGVFLAYLGFGATGALVGFLAGFLVMFLIAVAPFPSLLRRISSVQEKLQFGEFLKYSLPAAVALISSAILFSSDVILVKHFLSPADAGLYSAASTVAKVTLFLPGAITAVLFPKSRQKLSRGMDTTSMLRKGVLLTVVVCGPVLMLFWVAPSTIMTLLMGTAYLEAAPLLGMLGIAMTFYSIWNVALNYYLAIDKMIVVYIAAVCVILQLGLVLMFHSTGFQVALAVAASAVLTFLLTESVCRGLTKSRNLQDRSS